MTRATDADSYGASDPDALGQGDAFFVNEGSSAGGLYVCNTVGEIIFGTTNIVFTQIAATAVYSAGTGLALTGTVFSNTITNNNQLTNGSGYITSAGNAATATTALSADVAVKLQTARTIGGVSFDGTANINLAGVNIAGTQNTSGNAATATSATTAASCSGNAATATQLATARLLGGVSFNGTSDINLAGVNIAGNQNTSGSAASCSGNAGSATVLQTARTINGVSFNGSANITVADGTKLPLAGGTMTGNIVYGTNDRNKSQIGTYDSTKTQQIWSMGGTYFSSASGADFGTLYGTAYKHTNNATGGTMAGGHQMVWCDAGTGKAALGDGIWTSGNVTAYSDIRVKENLVVIPNAIDKVKQINGYTYDRTDQATASLEEDVIFTHNPSKRHVGLIAQELLKVLPEAVTGGPNNREGSEDDHYSVAYGNVVALLVEAIKEQDSKVGVLIEAIKELKDKVESLEAQLQEK